MSELKLFTSVPSNKAVLGLFQQIQEDLMFKLNTTNLEVCDLFLCVILLVGEGRLHSVDLPLRFQTLPVTFLLNLQKSRFQVSEHCRYAH